MSNKLLETQEELPIPTSDLSDTDRKALATFKEEGMPGLDKIEETAVARMMNLYLEGKSYRQISRFLNIKKPIVLYLADRFGWYTARREYLHELENTIRNRLIESKIVSQDFLLQLTQLWQKKIGTQITEYIRTGDESHANSINLKEVDKYLKTIEMLHKINALGPNTKAGTGTPAVGLNLGDGVTIKKVGENEVEVTPKQKTVGEMLAQYADFRRETENKESDIKEKGTKKQGDNDEN